MKLDVTVSIPLPGSGQQQPAIAETARKHKLPHRPNRLGDGLRGIRLKPSGRYDVRVSDRSGRRHYVGTFKTIPDAVKARNEASAQLEQIASVATTKAKVVSTPPGMRKSDVSLRDLGVFATAEDALAASLAGLVGSAGAAPKDKPQLIIQALWIAPQGGEAATETDTNG